jgi:hypothetical protein
MTSPKPRTRPSHEALYEQRTALVKEMVGKESAALDARTAKLRAMRLEKEALEPPPPPAPAKPKPRKKKIR